jgi:hypothetical protein
MRMERNRVHRVTVCLSANGRKADFTLHVFHAGDHPQATSVFEHPGVRPFFNLGLQLSLVSLLSLSSKVILLREPV